MNKLKIILTVSLLPCFLSAQNNFLPKEQESDIKTSGRYYWDECSDFSAENARQCAFTGLSSRIIEDAVNQSRKQEEVLKAIEMGAHFDNLQQAGKVKILAWIAKDSVFVTTQKPITKTPVTQPAPPITTTSQPPVKEQPAMPQQMAESELVPASSAKTDLNPVSTDDPVLKELIACKNFREVRRVATINGLVRGSKINSSEGFSNPEKCIIAVFAADGTLVALLDTGSGSRTDLLSGKTVQNPEQYYKENELWYLQQKQ